MVIHQVRKLCTIYSNPDRRPETDRVCVAVRVGNGVERWWQLFYRSSGQCSNQRGAWFPFLGVVPFWMAKGAFDPVTQEPSLAKNGNRLVFDEYKTVSDYLSNRFGAKDLGLQSFDVVETDTIMDVLGRFTNGVFTDVRTLFNWATEEKYKHYDN